MLPVLQSFDSAFLERRGYNSTNQAMYFKSELCINLWLPFSILLRIRGQAGLRDLFGDEGLGGTIESQWNMVSLGHSLHSLIQNIYVLAIHSAFLNKFVVFFFKIFTNIQTWIVDLENWYFISFLRNRILFLMPW